MYLQKNGGWWRGLMAEEADSEALPAVGGDTVLLFITPTQVGGEVYSGGGGREKGSWRKLQGIDMKSR